MLLKEARIFILRSSCPRMFEQLHNERKKKDLSFEQKLIQR